MCERAKSLASHHRWDWAVDMLIIGANQACRVRSVNGRTVDFGRGWTNPSGWVEPGYPDFTDPATQWRLLELLLKVADGASALLAPPRADYDLPWEVFAAAMTTGRGETLIEAVAGSILAHWERLDVREVGGE